MMIKKKKKKKKKNKKNCDSENSELIPPAVSSTPSDTAQDTETLSDGI